MQLPAIREKLNTISVRRKLLFLMLGVLILFLVLIFTEVIYCFNSEFCLLGMASSYPSLSKVTGVEETELGFKKGNFTLNENLGLITISGEIAEVEGNKLNLLFKDGSKKPFIL